MNIFIIGNDEALKECKARLGESHQYHHSQVLPNSQSSFEKCDVIFDFSCDWTAEELQSYANVQIPIFLNSIFTTLSALSSLIKFNGPVFGFCGLPTFFNRSILEVSLIDPSHQKFLEKISQELNFHFFIVKDQPGLVSARIIGMIISEAYEALQQGVASREDVDLSMKLGTNYPYGPFEWSDKIGMENIERLLKAIGRNHY